jgi:hypothetical protein
MRLNFFTSSIILLLLLSVAGFHAPARAQSRDNDSGAASISGRVTIEGKPAPGVAVTVTRTEGAADARKFSDTTDAEGRFNIVGVTPGAYAITPQAYAFVLSNSDSNMRNSKRVIVGAGETVDGLSLDLARGCVVTGRVIDEGGLPVVGGYARLVKPPRDGATYIEDVDPSLHGVGETDDRGVYRIFGVPAGRYLVRVGAFAGSGRDGLNYSVFYPNTRDVSKAEVIELSAGAEKTDINITIVPPEKTYSVSGRLIDAHSGRPVPYVYIGHQPLDSNVSTNIFPNYSDNRITDEEGGFSVAGLLPGRYRLHTSTISDRDTEWYSDDLIVEVAGADLSGIELKANSGASISGVIVIEGANDRRITATAAGLMVITSSSHISEDVSGKSISCRVGANGKFRLPGLRAGAFRLSVLPSWNPERPLSMERVEVGGQLVSGAIELSERQSISDARIVMVYGDGVVRGQLKFINGEPPENACFLVSTRRKGACLDCYRDFQARVSVGGQYMLKGLPPGDYELTLYAYFCGAGGHPRIAPMKQAIQVAGRIEARADFVVDLTKKDQ